MNEVRVDRIEETLGVLTWKVDGLAVKVDGLDVKVDGLDVKLDAVDQRLNTKIDGVAKGLEAKIEGVATRLDAKIDGVAADLNAKIDTLAARTEKGFSEVQAAFEDARKFAQFVAERPDNPIRLEMKEGFALVNKRFDKMEGHLGQITLRFDRLEERLFKDSGGGSSSAPPAELT